MGNAIRDIPKVKMEEPVALGLENVSKPTTLLINVWNARLAML